MATINTQFRNFKEPSREQLLRNFLSIPLEETPSRDVPDEEPLEKVEINAVRYSQDISITTVLIFKLDSESCGRQRGLVCKFLHYSFYQIHDSYA